MKKAAIILILIIIGVLPFLAISLSVTLGDEGEVKEILSFNFSSRFTV